MFIETLEFTIPVDLCDLFSSLKDGPRSNMEFPASVNSYGTTQDASIQVALRANKLTFVVDGVSSNASMISKSECKTLRLSVFDVDRTLIAQECVSTQSMMTMEPPSPVSLPSKRSRDFPPSQSPRAKSSRTSFSESPPTRSPAHNNTQSQIRPRPSNHSQPKPQSDSVNVKQEPEDPDLIEIEPDPEPDDIVPKKEAPYMQIDYSSDVPHTQTSQAALDRVSFPPTSRSQSSSFHQNVPHVQDFHQPGPSQGDQSADDFLVFQEDNDYGDNDNSADYSNDGAVMRSGYTPAEESDQAKSEDDMPLDCTTLAASKDTKDGVSSSADVSPVFTQGTKPFSKTLPAFSLSQDTQESFVCIVCQATFSNLRDLQIHAPLHGIFMCDFCPKQYRRVHSLRNHVNKDHIGKSRYVCAICGARYQSVGLYNGHMNRHSNTKGETCPRCGKQFQYEHNKLRHMKTCQIPDIVLKTTKD